MIFQFHTDNVTFFEEDKEYFEKRFLPLKKFIGSLMNDQSIVIDIKVAKNKHSSGNKFESSVNMDCPGLGVFHAKVSADNIRKCADLLINILRNQIKKAHDKKVS
jgi:ribosome-associated translation inhibitor RaiA